MKRNLLMLTNNLISDSYIYSQLVDIYKDSELFENSYIFCGFQNSDVKFQQANPINNYAYIKSYLRYPAYYWSVLRFLYENRKVEMCVHIRGFVSGVIYFIIPKFLKRNHKYIYDPRGLFLMELKESKKKVYFFSILSYIEKNIATRSLFNIVTTVKFKNEFYNLYKVDKIMVCYNGSSFQPKTFIEESLPEDNINVCYCGSINYWHSLDELYRLMKYISSIYNNCNLFIFTNSRNFEIVKEKFSDIESDLTVKFVEYHKLQDELEKMNICISVVRPTETTKAASPIKVSDYIMLDKIMIMNAGIGDFDNFYLEKNSALLYNFGEEFNFTSKDISNINKDKNEELKKILSTSYNRNLILTRLKNEISSN